MIKSYKQLTVKYLKVDKKRTLRTIIAIILSVFLISFVGLFVKALENTHIESIKNSSGSYHLTFKKTNEDLIRKITNNPKVSRSGLFTIGEEVKIGEELVMNKMIATNQALELLPYRIKEGEFPQNTGEIAVEKWILRYIDKDVKLGDVIKIKDKEYILKGILEDNINNWINNTGIILSINNNINKENAKLVVQISSNTNLKDALKELKNLGNKDTVEENTDLVVALEGEGFDSTGSYLTIGLIVVIVVVATIAVIYNAFQINVAERMKQFGLLRAIGMTPKQIRKIVLREASILALIGVPMGLLFGIMAIYGMSIAFKIIDRDSWSNITPSISPAILGVSALVGIIAVYISAWLPALFARRISPLVAISSRSSIIKEKNKRRRTILGKLFGFEGTFAAKNMKRNRKRYNTTVFSIVISVVLFITVTSFIDMTYNKFSNPNESLNIQFGVIRDSRTTDRNLTIDEKIIENIEGIKTVDKLYKVYNQYNFKSVIDKKSEIKEVQDIGSVYKPITYEGKERTDINSAIAIYDKNALEASKKYLAAGKIDIEKMNEEDGVILIENNSVWNGKTHRNYFGPIANIKVGDEIALQYIDSSKDEVEFGKKTVNKVKVIAILKDEPFYFRESSKALKIITTKELASKLIEKHDIEPISLNIVINDVKNEEIAQTQIEKAIDSDSSLNLINSMDLIRREKSSILMSKVMMYGFVVVISLISSANIINTITMNIILRKREFAVVRSIGLTQKGLKKMIVLEGIYYGIIGTIYGSIIGSGLSFLMYRSNSATSDITFRLPLKAIIIAGAFSIGLGYISTLAPLRRIKEQNIIQTIREEY